MGALRLVKNPETANGDRFAALCQQARHDRGLSIQAYRLLEDVCELSLRDGFCSAGQKHFARTYGTTERTVKRWEKELRDAGYLESAAAPGDRRRRILKPAWPRKIGDTARPVDRGHGVSLGDTARSEIGDTACPTPRVIYLPQGGRGARAHEGSASPGLVLVEGSGVGLVESDDPPAVAIYVSRCNRRPTSTQAHEVVTTVGEDPQRLRAWAVVCETWAATHEAGSQKEPYNLANHRGMLRHFAEELEAERARMAANAAALPEAQRSASSRQEPPRRQGPPAAVVDAAVEALDEEERAALVAAAEARMEPEQRANLESDVEMLRHFAELDRKGVVRALYVERYGAPSVSEESP